LKKYPSINLFLRKIGLWFWVVIRVTRVMFMHIYPKQIPCKQNNFRATFGYRFVNQVYLFEIEGRTIKEDGSIN
jgi:hypothetical protein